MPTTEASPLPRPPWWAARARLKSGVRAWWLARTPRTDTLTLAQRNVYVLPSRAGWMLAVTLATLLIASINYQLNLGYLLTFLLGGSAAAGLIAGHNTLRGLTLSLAPPAPVFAGQAADLEIRLASLRRRPRYSVGLKLRSGNDPVWTDVPAAGHASVHLGARYRRRGLHPVPALLAETRFPLGTFRIWAPWRPAAQVLIYPAPETDPPPFPQGASGTDLEGGAGRTLDSGEFEGVREYRVGDPIKRIAWKKLTPAGGLVTRETRRERQALLWFDWAQTGQSDTEQRLARLTAWVLAAEAMRLDYGLRLPQTEIAPDHGAAQRARCLRALALC
jgi:uncharacterized protein (DUF58 family)